MTALSAENRSAGDVIYQGTATDPKAGMTLNWSLSGTDAALFTIDATTGAVRFKKSPNVEAPADTGGNNVYDMIVIAVDKGFSSAALRPSPVRRQLQLARRSLAPRGQMRDSGGRKWDAIRLRWQGFGSEVNDVLVISHSSDLIIETV